MHCHGIVKKWEPGDDPYSEHRKHFPSCDFYLRIEEGKSQLAYIYLELLLKSYEKNIILGDWIGKIYFYQLSTV